MPHRHQEYEERCDACEAPTQNGCLHCGIPLCDEHAPKNDQRCAPCEHDYARKQHMIQRAANGELHSQLGRPVVAFLGGMFVVPTALIWSFAIGGALLAVPGTVAAYFGCRWWYRRTPPRRLAARRLLRKARRKFLAKRRRKALPPGES